MEYTESTDTDGNNVADRRAEDAARPSETTSSGPTAIERQLAADAARAYRRQTHIAANRTNDRHVLDYNTYRRKASRFDSATFLVLFLLIAAGIAIVIAWQFTDLGRVPHKANDTLSHSQIAPAADVPTHSSPAANSLPVSAAPTDTSTDAPKNIAETSAGGAISIPMADASLRDRPELLEQVVQVYKSQLERDPNDAAARTALNQLQAQSLSELEAIIANADEATAVKSLEIVARLFPELADSVRYKYLVARSDYIHRPQKAESIVKPESTPTVPSTPTPSTPVTTAIPSQKTVSPAANSSTDVAKKTTESASSSKPEIRTVTVTPGTMAGGQFVPRDNGNAFLVEISYRNFDKAFDANDEATLIARLGVPGDSEVLAEVPVDISGDRGTKSFVMETLARGSIGGKLQLNFILNDEFLTSRAVRLSVPR